MASTFEAAKEILEAYEANGVEGLQGLEGFPITIENAAGEFTFNPEEGSNIYMGDDGQVVMTYIGQFANGNAGDIGVQVHPEKGGEPEHVYVGGWDATIAETDTLKAEVTGDSLELIGGSIAEIFQQATAIMTTIEGTGFVRYGEKGIDPTAPPIETGKGAGNAGFAPDKGVILAEGLRIDGTDGPDELKMDEGNEYSVSHAGAGDDGITSREVNSVIYGEAGNDRIDISTKDGSFAYGGDGDDRLVAGDEGKEGWGGHQLDVLDGGKGNDTLINTGGYVEMTGGEGKDIFRVIATQLAHTGTTITDFGPGKTLEITGLSPEEARRQEEQEAGETFAEYNIVVDGEQPSGKPTVVEDARTNTASLVYKG